MLTIIFETHGTTVDNETHISSGWNDAPLSELGKKQAAELGQRYVDRHLDAVYCSELQRSYRSAEIAFADSGVKIIHDARLNECNYGDLNGAPSEQVEPTRGQHVSMPFPNGESYEQTCDRMKSFIDEIKLKHDGQTIMIIGHRATQYGLEHWLKGVPIFEAVTAPWHWQPGWEYAC